MIEIILAKMQFDKPTIREQGQISPLTAVRDGCQRTCNKRCDRQCQNGCNSGCYV